MGSGGALAPVIRPKIPGVGAFSLLCSTLPECHLTVKGDGRLLCRKLEDKFVGVGVQNHPRHLNAAVS